MTSARSRHSSLLMAKDQFTSRIPLSVSPGPSIIVSISQDYRHYPHHYDTPGTFDKTSWFVAVSQTIRLSTFKSNRQATTNCSALWPKQVKKLHTSKVKHTQTEQSERREDRYQTIITNLATNIHIFNQSPLIMLK